MSYSIITGVFRLHQLDVRQLSEYKNRNRKLDTQHQHCTFFHHYTHTHRFALPEPSSCSAFGLEFYIVTSERNLISLWGFFFFISNFHFRVADEVINLFQGQRPTSISAYRGVILPAGKKTSSSSTVKGYELINSMSQCSSHDEYYGFAYKSKSIRRTSGTENINYIL